MQLDYMQLFNSWAHLLLPVEPPLGVKRILYKLLHCVEYFKCHYIVYPQCASGVHFTVEHAVACRTVVTLNSVIGVGPP